MRAAVLLLLTGCATQIREARAIQPNPVRTLGSPDEIPQSVPLYVFIRDSMDSTDPLHRPAANEPGVPRLCSRRLHSRVSQS